MSGGAWLLFAQQNLQDVNATVNVPAATSTSVVGVPVVTAGATASQAAAQDASRAGAPIVTAGATASQAAHQDASRAGVPTIAASATASQAAAQDISRTGAPTITAGATASLAAAQDASRPGTPLINDSAIVNVVGATSSSQTGVPEVTGGIVASHGDGVPPDKMPKLPTFEEEMRWWRQVLQVLAAYDAANMNAAKAAELVENVAQLGKASRKVVRRPSMTGKRVAFREKYGNREALAMRADIDLLSLICESPPPNEIVNGIGIMYVRGPIDHHKNPLGVGESYERICEAFHGLNDDPEVEAIVMCIDSPGGVVAGLNETVYALREALIKPCFAFVDEMATSAAYAISCVADEIVSPRSAVAGSIGVISTMCSQARADEAMGLDFITITSGARKADGHPHMPIEKGAIDAESARVDELADQFYALVQKTRGMPPKRSKKLEAAIFLGEDAVATGIVDRVMSLNELLVELSVDGQTEEFAQTPLA